MCILCTINTSVKIRVLASFFINLIYSISDEIHQCFVPGRTGKIIDVGIDSLGIIVGIMLVYLVFRSVYKKKNNIIQNV